MIARGRSVTSSVRAAAMVAGAVFLAPCWALADSAPAIPKQIAVDPGPPLTFGEGGEAQTFIITVKNISPLMQDIGVKDVMITAILADGTDAKDTLKSIKETNTDCLAKKLAFGKTCTFTFAITPVKDGPASEEKKKGDPDSGVTSVEFTVPASLGPAVSTTVDFTVNDVGFPPPAPEPATLSLLAAGALGLAALAGLRRGEPNTTAQLFMRLGRLSRQ
jgi:hypothetical protein